MILNVVLLATHYTFLLLTMLACRFYPKPVNGPLAIVLGVLGLPILGLLTLVLLDFSNHAGNGVTGAWYLIFSVVTLGGVPIVTHLSAIFCGVCIAKICGWSRVPEPQALPAYFPAEAS